MSKKRPKMNLQTVIERLNASANPDKVAFKMAKFGIAAENALGVYQADLKVIASDIGLNSALGLALFDSGVYEARLLCSKVFDPADLSSAQMQAWAQTFENWEICDSFCMGLFARSPLALDKIRHWTTQEAEFVKRAGFATMAAYGFANKKVANDVRRFRRIMTKTSNFAPITFNRYLLCSTN